MSIVSVFVALGVWLIVFYDFSLMSLVAHRQGLHTSPLKC